MKLSRGGMGASMVKWTTPYLCLVLSEVIQIYVLTLNFVKKQFINILRTY